MLIKNITKKTKLIVSSRIFWGIIGTIIIAAGFFYMLFPPNSHSISNVKIMYSGENDWKDLSLPLTSEAPYKAQVKFDLYTEKPDLPLKVISDDCFRVVAVNNIQLGQAGICDWKAAPKINLPLQKGKNSVLMAIDNYREVGYFYVGNDWSPRTRPVLFFVLALGIAVLSFAVFSKFVSSFNFSPSFSFFLTLIPAAGLAINFLYFAATFYYQREYDVGGHLNYVEYILSTRSIPGPSSFWGAYQPPFYYILLVILKWLLLKIGLDEEAIRTGYQALSFMLVSAGNFLFWSVLLNIFKKPGKSTKQQADKKEWPIWGSTAIIFFLPGVVMLSSRINNDVLFYFFFALTAWFIFKVRKKLLSLTNMLVLSGITTAAILSKKHAVLLLPIQFWFWLKQKKKKKFWQLILILLPLPLASLIHIYSYRISSNPSLMGSGNNQSVYSILEEASYVQRPSDTHKVQDGISYWGEISLNSLLKNPFLDVWNPQDKALNSYFLEYLIRSSLSGEFPFPQYLLESRILMASYLLVLLVLIWGLLKSLAGMIRSFYSWDSLFALIFLEALFASLAFRLQYPYFCSQDFRYITFIVFPMAYLFWRAFKNTGNKAKYASLAITIFFLLASANFLLNVIFGSGL